MRNGRLVRTTAVVVLAVGGWFAAPAKAQAGTLSDAGVNPGTSTAESVGLEAIVLSESYADDNEARWHAASVFGSPVIGRESFGDADDAWYGLLASAGPVVDTVNASGCDVDTLCVLILSSSTRADDESRTFSRAQGILGAVVIPDPGRTPVASVALGGSQATTLVSGGERVCWSESYVVSYRVLDLREVIDPSEAVTTPC